MGLYLLKTRVEGTPASDTWIFLFGDTAKTLFGESVTAAANAAAVNTLLGVGSAGLLTAGIGAGQVRTNSQNESTFLQAASNLSDLASAVTARTNLGLGALATAASVGTAQIGAGAVTRAKLEVRERSYAYTAQAGAYTAGEMEYVNCTVGTSWQLDLPASPSTGARVFVNVLSISANQVLTIDGNGETIGNVLTTQVKLYAVNDILELQYSGSSWLILQKTLQPHRAQMSAAGWTASVGSTFTLIPFDTSDFDNAGMVDLTTERINIQRDGIYQVNGLFLADQSGPSHWHIELRKNGTRLHEIKLEDVHDYDASTERGGGQISNCYSLVAGDYIEFLHTETVNASPASYASLSVIEVR